MRDPLIKFGTVFKVLVGASYTVPETISSPSAANGSSGVSPTTVFDAMRATVGGGIYGSVSDVAGSANPDDIHLALKPGDVVALSAIGGGKCTLSINGVPMQIITATTFAAVLGYVG